MTAPLREALTTGRPIHDYAMLSDCRSAALVSRDGSIEWWCAPRFDSPATFAKLLDPDAGSFEVCVKGECDRERRYLDGTLVLQTTCTTPTGTAIVTEALALGLGDRGHDLGRHAPGVIVRSVECTSGRVEVELIFAPRFEYGLVRPIVAAIEGGAIARGGSDVLYLWLPPRTICATSSSTLRATASLRSGDRFSCALEHRSSSDPEAEAWSQREIRRSLEDSVRGWRTWSKLHQSYVGAWSAHVHHSGRVLAGLTYAPTGAIVAAPTTSLPESIGGARNWDYRFAWLRDANVTMEALWIAACPEEAKRFFAWMAHAAATPDATKPVQIMFGIGGEHDLAERELPHLAGWRGSRPVRIGNGAWNQAQLDVYGQVLSSARRFRSHLEDMDEATRAFFASCADSAADRWREPDAGIWEFRGPPQHFVYSKVMCWTALDAAVDLGETIGTRAQIERWRSERDETHAQILARGYDERLGTFVQAFDSHALDASVLIIPTTGFLPGTDPRVRSTNDAVANGLCDERGLIYRYRSDDGLEGREGTFLLCTFWLARALALAGEVERACSVFELALACGNDVGLYSEEIDPSTGEALGNYPQAFSHVGLITAASEISTALERSRHPSP